MNQQRLLHAAARPLAVSLLCLATALPAVAQEGAATLDALLAAAMKRNPGVTKLAAQAAMLEHQADRAGAWESPMLTVALQNLPVDSLRLDRDPMSMVGIELRQTLPFPGKNSRRLAVARAEATAAELDLAEARAALEGAMRQAFLELAFVREDSVLTREHVTLLTQLQDAARAKYENGSGQQEDLWRLEVQQGILEDQLAEIARQEAVLLAGLNAAAHRSPQAAIATPETAGVAEIPTSLSELLAAAVEHRPALAAALHRVEAAETASELASYEAWPDVSIFAAYGIRQRIPTMSAGTDMVSLGLSFVLPVFYGSRFGAEAAAMGAKADMLSAEQDELVTDLERELADGLADFERARAQARTYSDRLQPAARRTIDAVLSSYRADRAGFAELYDAEVMLLDVERTLRRARVETHRIRARLEATIGHRLP